MQQIPFDTYPDGSHDFDIDQVKAVDFSQTISYEQLREASPHFDLFLERLQEAAATCPAVDVGGFSFCAFFPGGWNDGCCMHNHLTLAGTYHGHRILVSVDEEDGCESLFFLIRCLDRDLYCELSYQNQPREKMVAFFETL